jgi:type II secretory pathway pseudopilin PulG
MPEESTMADQKGMTFVEMVVISCIAAVLLAIAIPKFMETIAKNKMWDGMSSLMTYEAAQLAYLNQSNKLGANDSLVFQQDSSEYFYFKPDGLGQLKAIAKVKIGRFKKGSWLRTSIDIDTTGGLRMPKIKRSCSKNDSIIVKKYISIFFN